MSASPDRARSLTSRLAALRREIEALEQEAAALAAAPPPQGGPGEDAGSRLARLRDDLQQFASATSAPTALNLLLTQAVRHGRRAVLFILRKGELWAWSALGAEGEKLSLPRLTLRPEESPALSGALQAQKTVRAGAAETWAERLGGPAAEGAAAVPLVSADRCTAVLWFEAGARAAPGALEAVECLAAAAGITLELIAHKRPGTLPSGGRVTPDERAIGASLPYALGEEAPAAAASTSPPAPPGPGLARQHEDARRLARLLVSEIKLYNEDKVVLGRKARDLYQRLREDIERSRQVYMERVATEVRASTDYFQQELVASLAEGDESLLGPVPAATG